MLKINFKQEVKIKDKIKLIRKKVRNKKVREKDYKLSFLKT